MFSNFRQRFQSQEKLCIKDCFLVGVCEKAVPGESRGHLVAGHKEMCEMDVFPKTSSSPKATFFVFSRRSQTLKGEYTHM